jgi:hypothetical protein
MTVYHGSAQEATDNVQYEVDKIKITLTNPITQSRLTLLIQTQLGMDKKGYTLKKFDDNFYYMILNSACDVKGMVMMLCFKSMS